MVSKVFSRESAISLHRRKTWRALIQKRSAYSRYRPRFCLFFANSVPKARSSAFMGLHSNDTRGIDSITARRKTRFSFFSIAATCERPPSFFFAMNYFFFPFRTHLFSVQALLSSTRAPSLTSQSKKGGEKNAETGSERRRETRHHPHQKGKKKDAVRRFLFASISSALPLLVGRCLFLSLSFCLGKSLSLSLPSLRARFPRRLVPRSHLHGYVYVCLSLSRFPPALGNLQKRRLGQGETLKKKGKKEQFSLRRRRRRRELPPRSFFRHFASPLPDRCVLARRQRPRAPRAYTRVHRERRR